MILRSVDSFCGLLCGHHNCWPFHCSFCDAFCGLQICSALWYVVRIMYFPCISLSFSMSASIICWIEFSWQEWLRRKHNHPQQSQLEERNEWQLHIRNHVSPNLKSLAHWLHHPNPPPILKRLGYRSTQCHQLILALKYKGRILRIKLGYVLSDLGINTEPRWTKETSSKRKGWAWMELIITTLIYWLTSRRRNMSSLLSLRGNKMK